MVINMTKCIGVETGPKCNGEWMIDLVIDVNSMLSEYDDECSKLTSKHGAT